MRALLVLALTACTPYRTYPLLTADVPGSRGPLEPTGVAVLPDGRVVMVAEGDAHALLVPDPDQPLRAGGVLDLLPLRDGREDCFTAEVPAPGCTRRHYRAEVRLREEPIQWIPRERPVTLPYNVEDLAPFGPDRVLGITEFSTVGRKTGYRKDYTARSRRQTERLFVLERVPGGWREVDLPEVERLRESLSDWGRGNCGDDMLVEGLAYDPDGERVFVGLRRCAGPAVRVLRYNLGSARRGLAAGVEIEAEGAGAGPTEGISGLAWSDGRLWALTAWDSYGYPTEAAFGGRLHRVADGRVTPIDLPGPFHDRPSALAMLPGADPQDALVLFDNDGAGPQSRPTVSVLRARIPRPPGERYAHLLDLTPLPDPVALGLNGFDLRWYNRDHRLSQLGALLDQKPDGGVGAWTRALGGLWQVRVGASLGHLATNLAFLGRTLGHNRQAAAYTDFRTSGLGFTAYRARLTVVPRDRERANPSVARLVEEVRPAYRVEADLPLPEGAGLVLQGFEVDTSARADRGICLAAMELGVSPAGPDRVALQASLVGGLCNDFDTRGAGLRHGRTTDVDGGVEVTLYFAVVEGAPTVSWSAGVFDQDRPGPRGPEGYTDDPERVTTDELAQAHLQCARVTAGGEVRPQPRNPSAPPAEWLSLGGQWVAPDRTGAERLTGAALSGFLLALDPRGFAPELAQQPMSEAEALNRNNYIHRYLVRAFALDGGPLVGGDTWVEGGLTHGIHRGLMKDNQRPSALLTRVDLTGFVGPTAAPVYDPVAPRRARDPNLLPEDGFIRWAPGQLLDGAPTCAQAW